MLYLVKKSVNELGEQVVKKVSYLSEDENVTYEIIKTDVVIEDRTDEYGEFYWDNDTDTLSVRYLEKEQIDKENTIQELKRRIEELEKADVDLGTQITDVDLGLLEHKFVDHEL